VSRNDVSAAESVLTATRSAGGEGRAKAQASIEAKKGREYEVRINNYRQLTEAACQAGPGTIGVAWPDEHEVLLAVAEARQLGLAEFILVGDEQTIRGEAERNQVDLTGMTLLQEASPQAAAQRVMRLIADGEAEIAMKGRVETRLFLQAVLDKEFGLRTGRLLTHVAVFEIPDFPRLILVSDAGVVIEPTLEQKAEIVQNAIDVALKLGIEQPKVAILAANEMVNPKLPVSIDAASLAKMADRGQIRGGLVDGPLALDNAVSVEAARVKKIVGAVAGEADVLVTPNLEAGNMLAKSITYFARGIMIGVVVGAKAPLIVNSRSDSHAAKLMSIALSVLLTK